MDEAIFMLNNSELEYNRSQNSLFTSLLLLLSLLVTLAICFKKNHRITQAVKDDSPV